LMQIFLNPTWLKFQINIFNHQEYFKTILRIHNKIS
jgi:hypothetical protein